MHVQFSVRRVLNRLDGLSPWAFTGTLYLVRWIVVLPLGALIRLVGVTGGRVSGAGPAELVIMVGFDPLLETVLECAIPYWLMRKCGMRSGPRSWGFVALSAAIMVLLHIGAWPAAILPAAVTGVFLAYTYGHFAANRPGQAIMHTWAFHSSINIVGWVLMAL
jgi:hypothetical protein